MRLLKQSIRSLAALFLFGVVTSSAMFVCNASAETLPIILNEPMVFSTPIVPGQESIELVLPVGASDSMRLQVIAPVNGVELTLLDPSNFAWLLPSDPEVSFLDGSLQSPILPGGIFLTPTIISPMEGGWKVQLKFPPAVEKTVVLATLFTETKYQVGMVLDRDEFRLGQTTAIGVIVLDEGQPITGLAPSIKITLPTAAENSFVGLDNGVLTNFDGLADDGIYSGGYTFSEVGSYKINGRVEIPTSNGVILRTVDKIIDVTESLVNLTSVNGSISTGSGGCIAGVNLQVAADILQPSTYIASAQLSGPSGQTIETSASKDLISSGTETFDLFFPSEEIRSLIGENGPYNVDIVDVTSFGDTGVFTETRCLDTYSFSGISLDDLCLPSLAISKNLTVGQTSREGYIESLKFSFPVVVANSGAYQVSFKITDGAGQDIQLFAFGQSMVAGSNTVEVNVHYEKLQTIDGPFSVESVLIIGGGASDQASLVGSSENLSRWQFLPKIAGDLDADGDVDTADRSLLLSFRGQPVLSPGDRRDLTGDGLIDLRDARFIVNLLCEAGSCPLN